MINNKPDLVYVVDDKLVTAVLIDFIFKNAYFGGMQTQNDFIAGITQSKIFRDD